MMAVRFSEVPPEPTPREFNLVMDEDTAKALYDFTGKTSISSRMQVAGISRDDAKKISDIFTAMVVTMTRLS